MNLFDFALKMELDGKAYYEKLADETPVAGLKNIFKSLAQDELKHYDAVSAMKAGITGKMADTSVLQEAQNVFQDLMTDKSVAGSLKKDLDGYRHGMKIEAESIRLYEDAARKETNAETARLFLRIAAEEQKHFNIMENLYDFVLAPQNYLAWAEFSNYNKEF